ncbi:hypothetical protein [Bradyrhizobium sp. CSS354]|uniref:hypothetical protein n=1 Tax=Bradyrhizobium sp. CSS354 TaxID=2699172 RepID=UPI0023B08948|nr:hypothetical protein [Bradyrhizobium sp. CSS354]MDE5461155.1 hypothetical protein [Bradyrhizobium sp. CSS354]
MTEIRPRSFMPPTRDALASEWRREFVRDATIKTLARMRKTSADEVRLELRSPVSPMKAADFPGDTVAALMTLAPESALAEILALAVKVDLSGVSQFSFPLPGSFSSAVFVEEGFPIPVGQGVFEGLLIGPIRKVAMIGALSNELENYSAPVASVVISHVIKIAVGDGGAKVLLSADAATAAAPAGLLNGVAPLAAGASISDDLTALISAIAGAGIDTKNVAFIAAPEQALALQTQPWPNFKHKVIEAKTLAAGTIIAIAPDGFVVAGEGVPVIETSKSTVLHMAEPAEQIATPGAPATIAAPVVSMFQTDSFALKCIARLTWSAAPGAVAWIDSVAW